MIKRAIYQISIGGTDVSANFAPVLLKASCSIKADTHSDTATFELDNKYGQIVFPNIGDPVSFMLGWEDAGVAVVFEGTVDEVQGTGSRGAGNRVHITGKSVDTIGKAKESQQRHFDNKSVQDILTEAGQDAGVADIQVAPDLASVQMPYWDMRDESFIHMGQRLAKEIGGHFKVVGGRGVMSSMNSGQSADGTTLASIDAVWGENLHSYSIRPLVGRTRYQTSKVRYYDKASATWKEETVETSDMGDGAQATTTHRHTAATQGEAQTRAGHHKKTSERDKGGGSVTIEGNTDAEPEGTCNVIGTVPGIDGTYNIDGVEHEYDRSGGFTTRLDLKLPSGSAGTDSR